VNWPGVFNRSLMDRVEKLNEIISAKRG
jgi:hypothetical protein